MPFLWCLAFALVASFLTACSLLGGGDGDATPSPSPAATALPTATSIPAPTATPEPVLGPPLPEAPEVRWTADELPVFEGEELPLPWDARTDDEPIWRLYESTPGNEPRLVYETPRRIGGMRWDAFGDSVLMSVTSRESLPNDRGSWLGGLLEVGLDGSVELRGPLLDGGYYTSPDQSQLLITTPRFRSEAVLLVRASGEVVQLDGFEGDFMGWTPDGTGLLFSKTQDNDGTSEGRRLADRGLYLLLLHDGTALRIATGIYGGRAWSPDGKQLALMSNGQVHIFDQASGEVRQLTHDERYDSAVGIGGAIQIGWSPDGAFVVVSGDLIDATSGDRVVRLANPGTLITATFTSDGRYFLVSEHPRVGDLDASVESCHVQGRIGNRTYAFDLKSGQQEVVLDCAQGFFIIPNGSLLSDGNSSRVVLLTPSCWNCDGASFKVSLLNLQDRSILPLTPDGASQGADVAPDGSRFVLTGDAPAVAAADGNVLQTIDIPEDARLYAVLWFPDSRRFLYIVGPKQLDLL
jgi:WD40 repeat protein